MAPHTHTPDDYAAALKGATCLTDNVMAALSAVAAIPLWRDSYNDGPDMLVDEHLACYFTPDQVRAARSVVFVP